MDNLLSSAMRVHSTAFPYERFNLSVHRAKTLMHLLIFTITRVSHCSLPQAGFYVSHFLSIVEVFIHRIVLVSRIIQNS